MRRLKTLYQGLSLLALSLGFKAQAALPTPSLPAGATATGTDWLSMLKALTKSGTDLATLIVSVVAFLIVGYAAITKFIEANNGRAAWGEVGLLAVVGVFVLVFVGYFLNQASTVMA